MMDRDNRELFGLPDRDSQDRRIAPLADRMRPRSLEEFEGQEHLLGRESVLRRMIEEDRLHSMVLWGPPGSGKTTLGGIMARETGSNFIHHSAVTCGVKEIKEAVAAARESLKLYQRRTILFLDEIHRFNKAQQDSLLPHVESGLITLIGATTENPSFEVISALLSRVKVFVLKPLDQDQIGRIVDRALGDTERGLGRLGLSLSQEARDLLAETCEGDARSALTALELAAMYFSPESRAEEREPDKGREPGTITLEVIKEALQRRLTQYDRAGEQHYDLISAFIKSLRGSDPDAALYYMARMLEGGEDPLFILRRMIILASEDIGNADPQALGVAVAARDAVSVIGLPEGAIVMSQAVTYLATAPKSNASYLALRKAQEAAAKHPNDPVPLHLRNAPTALMKALGYSEGYKYDHDYPFHYSGQHNLPESLRGARFYEPGELGFEREIVKRLRFWEKMRSQQQGEEEKKD